MEGVGGRWEKMEGHCSTGQSLQWAVVPMEEEEDLHLDMHSQASLGLIYEAVYSENTAVLYRSFATTLSQLKIL